jgi:hypothetical protein
MFRKAIVSLEATFPKTRHFLVLPGLASKGKNVKQLFSSVVNMG